MSKFWSDKAEKLLVPEGCSLCEECRLNPATRHCIYGGPFAGFVQANNQQHYNSKGDYNGTDSFGQKAR